MRPREERKVSYEEGQELAMKKEALFTEASAKSGLNVNEAFLRVV